MTNKVSDTIKKDMFIAYLQRENDGLRNALIEVMNYARLNNTGDLPALSHIERQSLDALNSPYGKPKV